jgi:hypothetical protein
MEPDCERRTEMTTPTNAPAKAPAKKAGPAKAAAKAPAKKVPATAATKISWTNQGEKNERGECEGIGTAGDREYKILAGTDGGKFTASVTVDKGKPTVLIENVSGKVAWAKCVAHNKAAA